LQQFRRIRVRLTLHANCPLRGTSHFSMCFDVSQQIRRELDMASGRPPETRCPGKGADTIRPSFRRNPPREGCRSSASGFSVRGLRADPAALLGSTLWVGCGKVTNRTSEPFRPVRHLRLTSYSAGTRLRPMRHPHKGSEPSTDRHRCLTEETKKREFQRQAHVSANYLLARTGVCWEPIDFVWFASEFN
jgi:hypothetical protein